MNESNTDRIVRAVAGIVLLGLAFLAFDGGLAIALGAVGGILLVTGAIGWCPLYSLFRFRTRGDAKTVA